MVQVRLRGWIDVRLIAAGKSLLCVIDTQDSTLKPLEVVEDILLASLLVRICSSYHSPRHCQASRPLCNVKPRPWSCTSERSRHCNI